MGKGESSLARRRSTAARRQRRGSESREGRRREILDSLFSILHSPGTIGPMPADLLSVQDQVVLVSGASRGIGRGLAEGFARRGASVVITGREKETLERAAKEID